MPILVVISLITSEVEYFLKHICCFWSFLVFELLTHFLPFYLMGYSPFSYSYVGIIYTLWMNSLLYRCITHLLAVDALFLYFVYSV